jgi:tetratricopeptide (TPR) repeat protein
MNFMLDDFYTNLARIGRIDVLQAVADKSVAHLESQDMQTLDTEGIIQSVKAYINAGPVYDQLEQSDQAQQMYRQAGERLQLIAGQPAVRLKYWVLASELGVQHSQVLATAGQQQETQAMLNQLIAASKELLKLGTKACQHHLWEAYLEYAYLMMEYGDELEAEKHLNEAITISQQQLLNSEDLVNRQYRY